MAKNQWDTDLVTNRAPLKLFSWNSCNRLSLSPTGFCFCGGPAADYMTVSLSNPLNNSALWQRISSSSGISHDLNVLLRLTGNP